MEYADLRPTTDILDPFVDATGGGQYFMGEGDSLRLPDIRRTRASGDQAGRSWLGLKRNDRYIVRASTQTPIMPALLLVLIIATLMGLGWWREGR